VTTRELCPIEHSFEGFDRARRKQRGPDCRRVETRQLEQTAGERVVPPPRAVESRKTGVERGNTPFHTLLEIRDAIARSFQSIDRLACIVNRAEVRSPSVAQPLECRGCRIERWTESQRVECGLPGAAAGVGAGGKRFRGRNRRE